MNVQNGVINEPGTLPETCNSAISAESSRCRHRFANRSRCRLHTTHAKPSFCPRHAKENLQPDDLTPELTGNPRDLDTFDGLHTFLEHLISLLSQNRISTRRAAVLGYLTSQLIRTLSAAHKQNASIPPQIIFDAPRPIRD
jgi:hypothetical protein